MVCLSLCCMIFVAYICKYEVQKMMYVRRTRFVFSLFMERKVISSEWLTRNTFESRKESFTRLVKIDELLRKGDLLFFR